MLIDVIATTERVIGVIWIIITIIVFLKYEMLHQRYKRRVYVLASKTTSIDALEPASEHDDKAVHVTGRLTTNERLTDNVFRNVEVTGECSS